MALELAHKILEGPKTDEPRLPPSPEEATILAAEFFNLFEEKWFHEKSR
jgi:hypothetical protein